MCTRVITFIMWYHWTLNSMGCSLFGENSKIIILTYFEWPGENFLRQKFFKSKNEKFHKCSESSETPRKVVFSHFWKNAYFAYFMHIIRGGLYGVTYSNIIVQFFIGTLMPTEKEDQKNFWFRAKKCVYQAQFRP